MSTKQREDKLDKRAKALRDNLRKRKTVKKEQASAAKNTNKNQDEQKG